MFKKLLSILVATVLVFAQLPVAASKPEPEIYVSGVIEVPTDYESNSGIEPLRLDKLESSGKPASPSDFETPELFGKTALSKLANGDKLIAAYDKIVSGIDNFDEKIVIYNKPQDAITRDELDQVVYACYSDHPEQYWNNVSQYARADNGSYLLPQYLMTKSQKERNDTKFNKAINDIFGECNITKGMTQYEISLAIHDTLARHITYDKTISADYIHTAYGAAVNGLAVCDGYARSYQLLLKMAGIQSYIVVGRGLNSKKQEWEDHAWNLVFIDGKYYYTDLTWDDQEDNVCYEYFNVTDELIDADHEKKQTIISFPACESTDANYFENNPGKMPANGDAELVVQLFELGRQRGENFARIKLTDGDINKFKEWLSADNNKAFFEITNGLGVHCYQYAILSYGNELHFWLFNGVPSADISTHIEPPHANILPYQFLKNSFDCNGDFEITKVKWKEFKNNKWYDIDGRFGFHTIYGIELTLKGKDDKYFTPGTALTVNNKTDHVERVTQIPSNEYVIIYTFDPTEDEPVIPTATIEYVEGSGEVEIVADITGTYTVVLADYDGDTLVSTKHEEMEFTASEVKKLVLEDLFPNADKVMLWDGESTLHPLCGALTINN